MKHLYYLLFILLLIVSCTGKPSSSEVVDNPETEEDTVVLTGYLGDGTGMSCFEFVTDADDTLYLSRTAEDGTDAEVVGEIKVNSDRYVATLEKGSEELRRIENVSDSEREYNKLNH